MTAKPPYRVMSMADIAKVRGSSGLVAVSTFSGCGGSCLGHEMAGFDVVWANEFVPAAQETFRLNHPDTYLDTRDIREVQGAEILTQIGRSVGEIDLFDGSPPCASFSTAGKRDKLWGKEKQYSDTKQRTDDLFEQYIRLVGELKPKVFVAENVEGLVRGRAMGYFKHIMAALTALGYNVKASLLDARWLGVPQRRKRVIIMGVRDDLGKAPVYPKPLPYMYSVQDAVPYIVKMWVQGYKAGQTGWDRVSPRDPSAVPSPTILANDSGGDQYSFLEVANPIVLVDKSELEDASIEGYAIHREWLRLNPGEQSDKYFSLIRACPDLPSPTITAKGGDTSAASVCHTHEPRKFTISELRRICGFPDDFQLTGNFRQQWERLGRAVPPVMMAAVSRTIREEILT